jgi:hypothetical protein
MKKSFFCALFGLTALLLFVQSTSAEAREHRRSRTSVQVNVGNSYGCRDAYVVRRYARPMIPVAPAVPVRPFVCGSPYYYAPVYVENPSPAYVEEVYVAPTPRPFSFAGLSLSWNFFN